MECTFKVGDKVTLKRGASYEQWWPDEVAAGVVFPQYGVVYTIRDIFLGITVGTNRVGPALWFVEIKNPERSYVDTKDPNEPSWAASDFRPVVEVKRDTDISFAHKILADTWAKNPAPTPAKKEKA